MPEKSVVNPVLEQKKEEVVQYIKNIHAGLEQKIKGDPSISVEDAVRRINDIMQAPENAGLTGELARYVLLTIRTPAFFDLVRQAIAKNCAEDIPILITNSLVPLGIMVESLRQKNEELSRQLNAWLASDNLSVEEWRNQGGKSALFQINRILMACENKLNRIQEDKLPAEKQEQIRSIKFAFSQLKDENEKNKTKEHFITTNSIDLCLRSLSRDRSSRILTRDGSSSRVPNRGAWVENMLDNFSTSINSLEEEDRELVRNFIGTQLRSQKHNGQTLFVKSLDLSLYVAFAVASFGGFSEADLKTYNDCFQQVVNSDILIQDKEEKLQLLQGMLQFFVGPDDLIAEVKQNIGQVIEEAQAYTEQLKGKPIAELTTSKQRIERIRIMIEDIPFAAEGSQEQADMVDAFSILVGLLSSKEIDDPANWGGKPLIEVLMASLCTPFVDALLATEKADLACLTTERFGLLMINKQIVINDKWFLPVLKWIRNHSQPDAGKSLKAMDKGSTTVLSGIKREEES